MATSLGTLELQLTANQIALQAQLNSVRIYASQVARDIELQINRAFNGARRQPPPFPSPSQAGAAGAAAGKSFANKFSDAIAPLKGIVENIFSGVFIGAGIGAFNSITGAIGLAIDAAKNFALEIFNVTKDFQNFESSLKTFLKGNQQEIDKFVAGLEKFAATTPFELRDLQQAAIQNLATGAKPDQIIKDLKSIGDVAAGANAELKDLMEIYAKSRTEGKLQNEDIDQFTGRGVQLTQELAKMLGATEKEIRQLATDGKLEFRHLEEALRRMSAEGGAYFGAMDNKAKTLEGRLSNVQDTFYQFQKSIGQAFEPLMNFAVQTFGEIISSLTSSKGVLAEVKKESEGLVKYFRANPELIEALNKAVQELVSGAMKGLLELIKSAAEYLKENPNAIKDAANWTGRLVSGFGSLVNILVRIGSETLKFANFAKEAFGFLDKAVGKLDEWIKGIPGVGDALGGNFLKYGPLGTPAMQELLKRLGVNLPGGSSPTTPQPQSAGNASPGIPGFGAIAGTIQAVQSLLGGNGGNSGKKYRIVESVGSRIENVERYEDLAPHHPSVVARGGHRNRPYGMVEGRKEELNTINRNLVKKDFVLIDPQGRQYGVPVPSPVSGYAGNVGQGWGAVNLYADKERTELIAQIGHMIDLRIQNGQFVQYGQTLGLQAGMGKKGPRTYGTHVDMSAHPDTYRQYIKDLQTGSFGTDTSQVTMRRTGQYDEHGLEKLAITINGQTFFASSGKRSTQNQFGKGGSTRSGSMAPLEYGAYNINPEIPGVEAGVGARFIPVTPTFKTQRSAIGFHFDADRSTAPGSAGCIVFSTQQEFDAFRAALKQSGAKQLVFEEGRIGIADAAQGVSVGKFQGVGGFLGEIANQVQRILPTGSQNREVLWGRAANYAPSDLSRLTERGKKAMEALKNPNVRAFLDAVAIAEIGEDAANKGGYGYLYGDVGGKETFNPNSMGEHPKQRRTKWGRTSSATGRYQTMDFVWNEEYGRLGLSDMKPQSQEIMAVSRLMYRGILDEIMRGDVSGVLRRSGNMDASSEWASIQGNPYGQGTPGGKRATFLANFQRLLQQAGALPSSQPQGITQPPQGITQPPSTAQIPASPTGGNAEDQRNLLAARRKLAEAKYREIKDEIDAATKQADNAQKQQRELDAKRREQEDRQKQAEFAAYEALAPDDEARGIVQKRAKLYEINNRYDSELIKLTQERDDLIDARNKKLQILAEAQKRGEKVSPDDIGVDYTKAINQLDEIIASQKQLRELELETNSLNQVNSESEAEKNKERQRTIEKLTRAHESYVNQLKIQQSLASDDATQQAIQLKIDKAHIEHEAKIALMPLQDQLDDLQDRKVYLLGEGGLKDDAQEVRNLQKEIDNLVAQLHSIADRSDIDLKLFETQRKQIEEQTQRLQEAEKQELEYNKQLTQLQSQISTARTEQQKAELQLQSDKLNAMMEERRLLGPLKQEYDDLVQSREKLINEGKLDASSDVIKALDNRIASLNEQIKLIGEQSKLSFDTLIKESQKAIEQAKFADLENALNKEAGFVSGQAQILSGQARLIRGRGGNEYQASALEAEAAKMQEQIRYRQELLQIEQQIAAARGTSNEYTAEEIATLQANAEAINKINLEGISQQVRTLGKDLLDVGKNALGSFFGDIISDSKSAGDAFKDLVANIAQQLTQLAVNALISNIFGGGGGKGGGFLGGILGFYQGGIVPNYAGGGSVGAVADALHRERLASGKRPVLAALTPGELVLTVQQAKRFQELRLDKVLNFANGGIVGGGQMGGQGDMTINIPVTVEGNSPTAIDIPQLQNALRASVLAEIQRQQRPGGALNK